MSDSEPYKALSAIEQVRLQRENRKLKMKPKLSNPIAIIIAGAMIATSSFAGDVLATYGYYLMANPTVERVELPSDLLSHTPVVHHPNRHPYQHQESRIPAFF